MRRLNLRIIAILMAAFCIFTLAACNDDSKENGSKDKKPQSSKESRDIRLPYSQEDSLNPYVAKSLMNRSLIPLIYDSLYVVDGSYEAQPSVAQSGTIMGLEVTVQLNTNKRFADGSSIYAKDVIYSFDLAKQSLYYSQPLINITKAQEKGSQEVLFTLATNDVYALSCLDFPIVKSGTAIDGTDAAPIASGRYSFEDDEGTKCLHINKSYAGYSPLSSKIELVNITDSKAIIHSLVIGNIDSLFCDLGGGSYERINAGTQEVVLNNFVFLGINKYNTKLADPVLRQSISALLDRERIINEGFQGYASVAYTPFSPKWYALKSTTQPGKELDSSDAALYIAKNAPKLNLKLLVNSDNEFKKLAAQTISQIFQSAGIAVTVTELPWESFNAAVASNNYDIYLGEIKLTNNMNLYPLFKTDDLSYAYYTQLLQGTITVQNFLDNFYNELPFIPIGYRRGVLAFSRHIAVEVKSCENDLYQNIGEWYLKD